MAACPLGVWDAFLYSRCQARAGSEKQSQGGRVNREAGFLVWVFQAEASPKKQDWGPCVAAALTSLPSVCECPLHAGHGAQPMVAVAGSPQPTLWWLCCHPSMLAGQSSSRGRQWVLSLTIRILMPIRHVSTHFYNSQLRSRLCWSWGVVTVPSVPRREPRL